MCNTITSNKLDHSTRDCTILIERTRTTGRPLDGCPRSPRKAGRILDSDVGTTRNLIRDGATSRYVCLKGLLEVIGIMSYLLSPKAILQSESRTLEKPIQPAQRPQSSSSTIGPWRRHWRYEAPPSAGRKQMRSKQQTTKVDVKAAQ